MEDKSNKPSAKRRAVLKGSLAAPVVLTVASPSAAASSFARCIRNAPNITPSESDLFLETWDKKTGWWREYVDVVQFTKDGQTTDWLYWDPGFTRYVKVSDPISTELVSIDSSWGPPSASGHRWLVAWFDDNGTMSRLTVQKPTSFKPSSVSCHASFAPLPGN